MDRRRVTGPSESFAPIPLPKKQQESAVAPSGKEKGKKASKDKETTTTGKRLDGRGPFDTRPACNASTSDLLRH